MNAVVQQIESLREAILASTLEHVAPTHPGQSDAERRQFMAAYLHLMCRMAEGDPGPRDDYLASVIPGLKTAGMPLAMLVGYLAKVDVIVAAHVGPQHLGWHAAFAQSYAEA